MSFKTVSYVLFTITKPLLFILYFQEKSVPVGKQLYHCAQYGVNAFTLHKWDSYNTIQYYIIKQVSSYYIVLLTTQTQYHVLLDL